MAINGSNNTAQALEHPPENSSQEILTSPRRSHVEPLDETVRIQASDFPTKPQDLTSQVLQFLSYASNETLGACVVALGATTWLILGRVGLIIIGLVGGVILHATWEGSSGNVNGESRTAEARKRREKGLDIVGRVLDWRERTKEDQETDRAGEEACGRLDFSDFKPETGAALTALTDAIIRDYVKWWYSPLLPLESAFPSACRQTLTGFLLAVSSHISRKRPADVFLDFLTNSSSIIIVFLSELSSALKAPAASGDASHAVHAFLNAKPSGSLANVLDVEQQKRKLRVVAEDILHNFLEPKAYACEPVRVFLREILAGVVLDMTVTSCSRPEFINEWIIWSLEESDTGLLEAIDAGVNGARTEGNTINLGQTEHGKDPEKATEPTKSSQAATDDRRTVSRAEMAMEEAMQEANRLSELIAAEEAKKGQTFGESSSSGDDTAAVATPTSSRDDLSASADESSSPGATPTPLRVENSMIIDPSPAQPRTESEILIQAGSKIEESSPSFTTFDQIIASQKPTALQASQPQSYAAPPLTLFNASVSIFDDSQPGEKGTIRSKPTVDYLLQIEPANSQHPGWMIARKYSDFETLHEVLRRISVVSGVTAFAQKYQLVPTWKSKTKAAFRSALEDYLRNALSFQRLAESEGMKRFLEKDQGLARTSPGANKSGFGFPSPAAFETMSKGMLDVLASAPKGAAGGGKAILGGVTGVLGGVGSLGQKKQVSSSPMGRGSVSGDPPGASASTMPPADSNGSARPSFVVERNWQEHYHLSVDTSKDDTKPPLPPRQSHASLDQVSEHRPNGNGNIQEQQTSAQIVSEETISTRLPREEQEELHLPPPPSEIPDDYNICGSPTQSTSNGKTNTLRTPTSGGPAAHLSPSRKSTSSIEASEIELVPSPKRRRRNAPAPLSRQEASVAVELFFATINELYTLSSAWTLRLTLLNAAKSFLLRPSNPNLEAIRVLLQDTIIDANTSDSGLATFLTKLRENAIPTEEELNTWPPPRSEDEKERMRQKARKLLVEKGMPQALTSVMGAAASGEALGRVFNCLQVPEVARGLIFALILQGVRAVTQ